MFDCEKRIHAGLVNHRENFALTHDDQFFTIDLDSVAAGVLAENDGVADLDSQRTQITVIQNLAVANSD